MSIAPVSSVPSDRNETTANQNSGSGQAQASSAAQKAKSPVSNSPPQQETRTAKKAPAVSYQLPQDVVEVHQDPNIKGQVIIEYLNQSKDVVLQVPSSEEQSVERGIAQEFQQEAKQQASAATAATGSEGSKGHGD